MIIKQLQISAFLETLFFGWFGDRWGYSTSEDMRANWIDKRSEWRSNERHVVASVDRLIG